MDASKKLVLYTQTRDLVVEYEKEFNVAKQLGFNIILADYTDKYREDPRVFAHVSLTGPDSRSIAQNVVAQLKELQLTPNAIVCWKDAEVEIAAHLCEFYRLPFTPVHAAERIRSKATQREQLRLVLGANPEFEIVTDEASFQHAFAKIGTPCLLKPAGASGAKGIRKIVANEDPLRAYQQYQQTIDPTKDTMFRHHTNTAVLERCLTGSEHSVSGVIFQGRPTMFALSDKRLNHDIPIEYQNKVPTSLPNQQRDEMLDLAKSAVLALELNNCGFHVDMMMTEHGPKVLEVGSRLGGYGLNATSIGKVTGFEPYEALLKIANGQDPFPTQGPDLDRPLKQCGLRIVTPPHEGVIKTFSGIETVLEQPQVSHAVQLMNPGDEVVRPPKGFYRFRSAYFLFECDLSQDFDHVSDELASLVHIEMQ